MDRQAALDGISDVVHDVLGDDDIAVGEDMAAGSVDGWDSMAHINIVIGIEKHFGLRFTAADLAALRTEGATIGAIVDLVVARA